MFVLSGDDNETAAGCFQLAEIAHTKGRNVARFFIDGGVTWADKARSFGLKTAPGDCPNGCLP